MSRLYKSALESRESPVRPQKKYPKQSTRLGLLWQLPQARLLVGRGCWGRGAARTGLVDDITTIHLARFRTAMPRRPL